MVGFLHSVTLDSRLSGDGLVLLSFLCNTDTKILPTTRKAVDICFQARRYYVWRIWMDGLC